MQEFISYFFSVHFVYFVNLFECDQFLKSFMVFLLNISLYQFFFSKFSVSDISHLQLSRLVKASIRPKLSPDRWVIEIDDIIGDGDVTVGGESFTLGSVDYLKNFALKSAFDMPTDFFGSSFSILGFLGPWEIKRWN